LGNNRRQRVYHARHEEQNRDVALKFIKLPPNVPRQKALEKIQIESNLLKQLKHPNLVKSFGAGVSQDDDVFFASELIKGESLSTLLSRRGKLAPDVVVDYGLQIARLLEYLHGQEILHAKLTPDKVIIDRDGVVKVADLRLNRSKKRRWDASSRRELDIAAYMAPEQFVDGATPKSDIYALGVILHEMLTGKLPYEPDTMGRMTRKKMREQPPSIAAHVMSCPIWLDKIVCQMLKPAPRDRPHTAHAVVLALEEIHKIETQKKSAVVQVSGHFNPLTAGTDKTEANRLLGKKESKLPSAPPFYESSWFLIACLVLIAVVVGWAVWPQSSQRAFDKAMQLMDSDDSNDWHRARDHLQLVIDRGKDDEYFRRAEDLYYESRRRTLVQQAEWGQILEFQTANARRFGEAVDFQKKQKYDEAIRLFQLLVETVETDGNERHIYVESLNRLKALNQINRLPTDVAGLKALIDELSEAETETELHRAQEKLSKVIVQYSGNIEYAEVLQLAQEAISRNRQKLEELAN
jgi:serine/threonine protein kinase